MTDETASEIPFGRPAGALLDELSRHNTREWFSAHRHEYDELIAEPLHHLLTTAAGYGPGRVMRPQRDVRFSKDKTPYKTTASMWAGATSGIYLQIDASGLQVGGGLYDPTRDQLERAREAIADHPTASSKLDTILEPLKQAGFELAGPSLTTAPRGYARDHPAITLLRLRHYAATLRIPIDATTRQIHHVWSATTTLNAWVDEHIGLHIAESPQTRPK